MVSAARSRPAVASLAGGIVALLLALVSTIGHRQPGQALGPVVAITPNEVTANGFVGYVRDVELSGRGETAGVRDDEVSDVGFVHFDDGDHEPMVEGQGIGVSGDGCTAVQVDGFNALVLRVIRRCAGTEEVVAELPRLVSEVEVSVSFDGRFAALSYGFTPIGDDVGDTAVTRLDTTTGTWVDMPPLGSLRPWSSEFGVDIDDSGRFVVAPISDGRTMAVATWDTATGAVTNVAPVTAGRFAGMPSISGDGAWVSFASNQPRSLGETGGGPWVYVIPRGGGAARLVSQAAGIGYFSSLSSDGTQVAFSVSNGFVPVPTTTTQPPIILLRSPAADSAKMIGTVSCPNPLFVGMFEFESRCPPARIDVAYSATPGLVGAFQTETVSRAANGAIRGTHRKPELSGNGRWVAWLSDDGDALLGADQDLAGMRHAFMRRRDPGLVVDSLAFPSISVNTTIDATTTVRNTGRTSVWIEEITPSPGVFIHVGGTCAFGMSLGPGATCTVAMRYSPGATTGPSSGTLRVGEIGYDRVFATGTLTGSAAAPPVLGQPTTTTSTSLPPRTSTTTTTTTQPGTPTTRPGSATLSATPNPVEFGSVAVGFASDPQNVTVTNNGSAGGLIQTSLGGAHPDDYWVRTNGCGDTSLDVGGQCQIEVLLIPRGGGIRTATLTIRSGSSVVNVTLNGNGTFQPRLAPMPATVTKHGISTIYGQGFPPGETFTVTVLETGLTLQGTSDETGLFRTYLPASGNLLLGAYTLHVDGVANSFGDVESTLLVALGTFRPQGEGGPAFGNTNLIVARGG